MNLTAGFFALLNWFVLFFWIPGTLIVVAIWKVIEWRRETAAMTYRARPHPAGLSLGGYRGPVSIRFRASIDGNTRQKKPTR